MITPVTAPSSLRDTLQRWTKRVDEADLFNMSDNMNVITYSHARENLARTITEVCESHSPVIITKKGTNAVVMMPLEDFESMQETTYLLRSPKNARRLLESIQQLEKKEGIERELTE